MISDNNVQVLSIEFEAIKEKLEVDRKRRKAILRKVRQKQLLAQQDLEYEKERQEQLRMEKEMKIL